MQRETDFHSSFKCKWKKEKNIFRVQTKAEIKNSLSYFPKIKFPNFISIKILYFKIFSI